MAETLLKGSGITQRWGGLVAVNKVSIEIERGSVHGVIGTNGAGKSTLINILSGEFPPTEGKIELLGKDADSEVLFVGRGHIVFHARPDRH